MTDRVRLSAEEQAQLKTLVAELTDSFSGFDNVHFLKDLPLSAYRLPKRVVRYLNEFKYNPPEGGSCIISTGILDDVNLGPTPPHWELPTTNDTCQEAVMTMCLCATLLGDIFGWLTQQDGRVVHDVLPIKLYENEQLGCGSREELTWHTEDAFHELRGDYLIMMCLRNSDMIPTTLSKPDYSRLTKRQIDVLFEERFSIRPDHSHMPKNSSTGRVGMLSGEPDDTISRAYDEMLNRDSAPEKIAVLFGNKKNPFLRIDPYFMDEPEGVEAKEALEALTALVAESLVEVVLYPGEILIIDNYEVVHGRRAFRAKFDGTDRWYKRINVLRDIRRCHNVLDGRLSRVIY